MLRYNRQFCKKYCPYMKDADRRRFRMKVHENYIADINSPHLEFFPAMFFRPEPSAEMKGSCIMLAMKGGHTAEYALARKDPVKYLEMKADVERDVVCCPLKLEMMMHLINDGGSSQ